MLSLDFLESVFASDADVAGLEFSIAVPRVGIGQGRIISNLNNGIGTSNKIISAKSLFGLSGLWS